MRRIAIIGAGPTGLSAALRTLELSPSTVIDIYDSAPRVGGLSCSIELFDHIVDLGPHRFYTQNQKIMNFWLDLAQGQYHRVERQTRVLYKNHFISYPLQVGDLLRTLPLKTKMRIVRSFLKRHQYQPVDGDNFSSTMKYRFGDELYKMFFKNYTERLWGVRGEELSAKLAYQRIGDFGLWQAVKHAFKSAISDVGDFFYYPTTGCGQIWQTAYDRLQRSGAKIYLSTPVIELKTTSNEKSIVVTSLGEREYDHVISTMPLSQLVQIYQGVPKNMRLKAQRLQMRSTLLVYVEIHGMPQFEDQWIYIHSPHVQAGRITNFANWGIPQNEKRQRHTLCLEYWCTMGDSFWSQNEVELCDIAEKDLTHLGYSPDILGRTHVIKLPNTYPVLTSETETILNELSREINHYGSVQSIGRAGAFKYNNQDHCMEMGFLAAEKIFGIATDPWAVNSRSSYLEEQIVEANLPPG